MSTPFSNFMSFVKPMMGSGEYLILDTEATGFSPSTNRVIQVGLLHARSHCADLKDGLDVLISTPYDPVVWGAVYLRESFVEESQKEGVWSEATNREIDVQCGSLIGTSCPEFITNQLDAQGKRRYAVAYDIHHIHADKTVSSGFSRREAVTMIHDQIRNAVFNNIPIIGHNIGFDIRMLMGDFERFQMSCPFSMNDVIDTGLLVKAARMNVDVDLSNGLGAAWDKIRYAKAKGVKWSLESCVSDFNLDGIDTSKQHASASYDCYVVHKLIQRLISENPWSAAA